MRKCVQFKIDGELVVEHPYEMNIKAIAKMKLLIAAECDCLYDDIEVEYINPEYELSEEFDVSPDGIVNFEHTYYGVATGIECIVPDGSDEFLDAMSKGTMDELLKLSINKN